MKLTGISECAGVADVLRQVGDKWTVQIVVVLYEHPRRFNELRRGVPSISQQMLTRTLKALERDGLVTRTVHTTAPPQVEYALTTLGRSLSKPIQELAAWAVCHRDEIRSSRQEYDAKISSEP